MNEEHECIICTMIGYECDLYTLKMLEEEVNEDILQKEELSHEDGGNAEESSEADDSGLEQEEEIEEQATEEPEKKEKKRRGFFGLFNRHS